jgi:hypothetical protein
MSGLHVRNPPQAVPLTGSPRLYPELYPNKGKNIIVLYYLKMISLSENGYFSTPFTFSPYDIISIIILPYYHEY